MVDGGDLSLDELFEAMAHMPELTLVGGRGNFHFKGRGFLHFHEAGDGGHDAVHPLGNVWEEVSVATSTDRLILLALVADHVEAHRRHQGERSERRHGNQR